MVISGVILGFLLLVFACGRSPVFRVDRAGAAVIGVAAMVGTGVLSFDEAAGFVDARTLAILFSMMVMVAELKLSRFFDAVGMRVLSHARRQDRLLLAVVMISGVLSAFCINDVVCLLLTPIVLSTCEHIDAEPLPYLLGVAMASNIGSAATLVGNPQNVLIAGLSGMSFTRYFLYSAPVSLAGLGLTYWLLRLRYRETLQKPIRKGRPPVGAVHAYLAGKGLTVMGMVLAAFFLGVDMAVASLVGAAALLLTRRVKPGKIYASIDFNLLVIFTGLFVVVGGVEKSGLTQAALKLFSAEDLRHLPLFSGVTAAFSNIFSNVPAVMLLRPVVPASGGDLWWTALALFSTLAGNLTITGSIANLIVAESAKRRNVHLGFWEYLKTGLPLTALLCLLALLYLSFVRPA